MDRFSSVDSTSFIQSDYERYMDYLVSEEEFEISATSSEQTFSQTDRHQENEVETSEGSYQNKPGRAAGGGGRTKLSDAQRREHRKESDLRYRQKKKRTVNELTEQNKQLKEENAQMFKKLKLKEYIESQQCNGQLSAAAAPERQESSVSQPSYKQIDHQSILAQDHNGTDFRAADRLTDLEENDADLQNLNQKIQIFNPVAANEPIAKLLMQKIEADDESNVCFSDFTGLDGERVKVGKYNFPISLRPVVEKIIDVYGDVALTSKMNLNVIEATYILFCASVKEMEDLPLEEANEDRILKWRDSIRDALRINFKVDFAMEHLKKIAHAYIGRIESHELENMSERISKLEADLNTRKEELAKRKEVTKKYLDAAEQFNGKTLSLFLNTG